MPQPAKSPNLTHRNERVDLAAAFRWTAGLNMHEAVANHFSLAVNGEATPFLVNPNQRHFSRIRASDLPLLDANDPSTMDHPNVPDPTAWGLHGSIHRLCPHARCAMLVHSIHARVLACLADSTLPPVDKNTAAFYGRHVVDQESGGLAFEGEAERCAALLANPPVRVMVMGNHGLLVIGDTLADRFNRLYHFERAAKAYVRALQTGLPLRAMPNEIAERTARDLETYPGQAERHLAELKAILDQENPDYAN